MITPKLLFTEKSIPLILEAFDKFINKDGLIIESSTGEPALTSSGEEITIHNFGGMKKGLGIIKDDLHYIINLSESIHQN